MIYYMKHIYELLSPPYSQSDCDGTSNFSLRGDGVSPQIVRAHRCLSGAHFTEPTFYYDFDV